jgi:hypothetical protein
MTSGQGRRGIALGFAVCVSLITAAVAPAGAVSPSPPPPLLAFSESAASGTRPVLATHLAGSSWATPVPSAAPGPFTAPGYPLHWKVARTSPDRQRQVVLFQEDDNSLRDRLWATFWNGSAWTAGDGTAATTLRLPGVNDATLWSDDRQFDAAFEQKSGELLVVSGINTDEWTVHWTHSGTTWTGHTSTAWGNTSGAGVFDWVRLAARPGTNQIAFVGIANEVSASPGSFAVHGGIWDGDTNTWGAKQVLSFPTAGSGTHTTEAIDVAFTLRGDHAGEAVAVWGKGNAVLARVWNETTGWGTTATVATFGAGTTVRWLRLAADPSGDDLVLAIGDVDGTTGRLTTVPYDGGTRSWGTVSPYHTMNAFGDLTRHRPFDLAWDPIVDSRNVLLAYADASGLWSSHSTNGGVTFGSPRAVDDLEAAYWVRLERRPGGEIDLAAHDESNDLRAWRWNGYDWGSTTPVPLSANLEPGSDHDVEPFALASVVPAAPPAPPLSDFNGDGKADLLWHNATTGALFVWFLDRQAVVASSYLRPESFADTRWQIRALGDFSGDGKIDVLWHHVTTGDLYVWFLDGTVAVGGSYLTPRSSGGTDWVIRGTADLDADGHLDLLWHHQTTGELYVWFMDGLAVRSGAFLTPRALDDTRWQIRGVADLSGDGKPDLLWHNQVTGELYAWLMNGTTVASGAFLTSPGSALWRVAEVADFDGDRKPDLLWHHKTTGELYFWFLDGLVVKGAGYLNPSRFADPRWSIAPR